MTEKQDQLIATNFRFLNSVDDILHFDLKANGDTVLEAHCRPCPLITICYGEKGQKSGKARINLNYPIAQNLTSEQSQSVPCGAGIEVIQRRPIHK